MLNRRELLASTVACVATLPFLNKFGVTRNEWTPVHLFADGKRDGAWYDMSNRSLMFQDEAGTVPVTAVGQPVARINSTTGDNPLFVRPARAIYRGNHIDA